MFDQIFTALLAFLITNSAHAQVSAPNCSNPASAWVGYHWQVAEFVIINALFPPHSYLVVQFSGAESMSSRGVPSGDV